MTGVSLSDDLTDTQWLVELEEIGEEAGYFSPLGDRHAAVFADRGQDVLLVSFESLIGIRSTAEDGLPLGFSATEGTDWSHLNLVAMRDTWFRDPHVYGFFDRLVDEGFFEDFDTVIFYGAGMGGYAAAAYSVVAPGATVIAVSPQATLDRAVTEWDDRFPATRRTDFRSRYGYAPDMIDAAAQAFVLYDPGEIEDAMHASLFRAPNVTRIRYRRGRSGAIDADLKDLGILPRLVKKAAKGKLTARTIHKALRRRRGHLPYLRALLGRVLAQDRPWLTAVLCRAVLMTQNVPRFRHYLDEAEARLLAEGRTLPEPRTTERST